jgi:hypothetical protein
LGSPSASIRPSLKWLTVTNITAYQEIIFRTVKRFRVQATGVRFVIKKGVSEIVMMRLIVIRK